MAESSAAGVLPVIESPSEHRRARDTYFAAAAMVLLSIVFSIAFAHKAVGLFAAGLLQGITLLAVLRVSGARPKFRFWATVSAAVAIALAAVVTYSNVPVVQPAAPLLWGLIVLGAMGAIVKRLVQFNEINLQVVFGLLTLYLLLGVLFAYVFALAGVFIPFFNGGQKDHASYVYFAFVTLSTTGYGDLTPVEGLPRALAVGEAMFGQLYLVSVVSLAVGRIAGAERNRG